MQRAFYNNSISNFLIEPVDEILGKLARYNEFSLETTQRSAWTFQIELLQQALNDFQGDIYFEYAIPRMGKRIDVLLLIQQAIFVLEFKVGEKTFNAYAIDQVYDYALDLKNFHNTSHQEYIAPILIATHAIEQLTVVSTTSHNDKLLEPICVSSAQIADTIRQILLFTDGASINVNEWKLGRYQPTPTIIEAATALYNSHSVEEITRHEADKTDLRVTSGAVSEIIQSAKQNNTKAICFVTGVPGAGKTLVGLDIATKYLPEESDVHGVFLSGNGPLVNILQEALTRDKVRREKEAGKKITKSSVRSEVKTFIQNVHHFRDDCLRDEGPPFENVAIFDEAQRAWNHLQTANFMARKKNRPNFTYSEPEFLISCLDRRPDWAVIVCLVGGGQEINTGEAGISEWIDSLNRSFPDWQVYISPQLTDDEYAAGKALTLLSHRKNVCHKNELHLHVSMRSYRAEHVSLLVKHLLDRNLEASRQIWQRIQDKYPIVITRDLTKAKHWLKEKARGSERYGMVVSSQAQRLKPLAIDVRSPMDPVHWFLDGKEDVRSSYYLEDVATEFQVQGLELDWACVTWDADFRYTPDTWETYSFAGSKWQHIRKEERKQYLKNAYRVLLTRARQGMVIVVPTGDVEDPTRNPAYYNNVYAYLENIGFDVLR